MSYLLFVKHNATFCHFVQITFLQRRNHEPHYLRFTGLEEIPSDCVLECGTKSVCFQSLNSELSYLTYSPDHTS